MPQALLDAVIPRSDTPTGSIEMDKPEKPTHDFPLFAHASGKWAKKINGRTRYFGRWDDPVSALEAYRKLAGVKDDTVSRLGPSLESACNQFLAAKDQQRTAGELASRSFEEYRRTCKRLVEHLGRSRGIASLTPADFASYRTKMAEKWNLIAVGNDVTRVRSLFKWCLESRLIKEPMHFGPDFKRPSAKAARRHRRLQGVKLFTPEQIRLLIDEAGTHMRAMILLAINCGFGPADCATLPLTGVNLDTGWLDYPRPKTEIDRHCPLWPETVTALQLSLLRRYQPGPDADGRFFVMHTGRPWDNNCLPIAKQFRQAAERAGISKGSFYWLRHCLETVGGAAKDQVALGAIMGHVDRSMAATYREEIAEERLLAVTNYVRGWLFGNS